MVQSNSSSSTYATHAMPVGWACAFQTCICTTICTYQHAAGPCAGPCTVSKSCSVASSSNAADDFRFTIDPLSSPKRSQLHLQQTSKLQQPQQAAGSAGHSQSSRCTWPAFASLSANSQLGKWHHLGWARVNGLTAFHTVRWFTQCDSIVTLTVHLVHTIRLPMFAGWPAPFLLP